MNRNILLFLRFLFPLLLSSIVHADVTTYRASLQPTPSSTFQDLDGFVAIFTESGTLSLGYAGIIEGVEGDLLAASCNATNGCGVHIHNGTSCSNTTTQGGHYYVISEDVTEDPWIDARYSSDADGKSNFQGLLNIGTTDIDGRVFLGTSHVCTRTLVSQHYHRFSPWIRYVYRLLSTPFFSSAQPIPVLSLISSAFGEWNPHWVRGY